MLKGVNAMENYYVGLDMGTDAIGWAVTDEEYSLLKFKGNAMWGIRLLEESKTALERRTFRNSRRRLERKKFREQCLQMLFDVEISKVDNSFYQRLKESNLYLQDKTVTGKYALFADVDFNDKDYYKNYPTIYHLRKELIENKEPHDVRLVYLALSHIIKNRGHFLFDSDLDSSFDMLSFSELWNNLNIFLSDNYGFDFYASEIETLEKTLKNTALTKTKKKDEIIKNLSLNKKADKQKCEIVSLMVGLNAKSAALFNNDEYKDSEAKDVILSSSFDENAEKYETALGDDFELIVKVKEIYDWALLANILKGSKYISFAKVEEYEAHKSDLKLLKNFVKEYCGDQYNLIFNVNAKKVSNYLAYSKHAKNSPAEINCTQEDFCKFLRSTLPKKSPSEEYDSMYDRIADNTFMPKIVSKDNGIIPMQVTKMELEAILNNACEYLPFLNEKDEDGLSVKDKIIKIHSYRIPYYVGPLNRHSDKHWLVRTDEKIYPWNFEKVVDIDKSAEKFIENLTSKCTYLPLEDVVAKNSLLYSSFTVLNELNNLKIDGEPIEVELKQEIYHDLFERSNKVTRTALNNYLKSKGITDAVISGIDGDFKSNLKPYRDLKCFDLSLSEKEEIIKAITIFGDDKKLLKRRLKNKFGNVLSEKDILKISKLKYTGWGKLSKKVLVGIEGVIGETGEVTNIIRAMWETNNNLMEILSGKNTFFDEIEKENGQQKFTSLKEEVEDLYVSPKIKRPIYQTMQIVDEIAKIKGSDPKKIFVEVTRGEELEKTRKASRKDRLLELYKSCKSQESELYDLLQTYDESSFRRDALYLYFTQFGRCMYTGEKIELSDLYNRNIYDIDHIYPRSKIKDDSLDNRVLVLKTVNQKKDNVYPLNDTMVTEEAKKLWKLLLSKGLISRKKYDRLTRKTPLTDDELSAFISRQIVETSQSTKATAELLKKKYPNTEIVYVKARNVSEFRNKELKDKNDNIIKPKYVKCREVNDYHHAKDAYLNIVVGNVYNTQFNHNRRIYISGLQTGKYSVDKIFNFNIKGAWVADSGESIAVVNKVMQKNNIRFTRYCAKKTGGLFDQMLVKKGSGQVPIKGKAPFDKIDMYGAYNKAASAYVAIVEYTEKKKTVKAIVSVDMHDEKKYLEDSEKYIAQKLGVDGVKILIPCLKYNSLISVNGFRMHISGKANGGDVFICKPAVQLVLGTKGEEYIKLISNYLSKCTELNAVKEITEADKLSAEENIALYDLLLDKLSNTVFKIRFGKLQKDLASRKDVFLNLNIHDQCFTLIEILKILHSNASAGNLSFIGYGKTMGKLSISYNITKSDKLFSFKVIHQSITGLFEQEEELLN